MGKKDLPDFSIAYTIHNKESLMPLIADGLRLLDSTVEILVLFDGCDDNSLDVFLTHAKGLENLKVFENIGGDLYEVLSNNYLLKQSTSDYCILFQDDMVIRDNGIIELLTLMHCEIENIGVVGFKDGFAMQEVTRFTEGYSSPWSDSKYTGRTLEFGEWKAVDFVNRGPLAIAKKAVAKIGYLGTDLFPLFWDDCDFCIRARNEGFSTHIAYSNILTRSEWGTTRGKSKVPLSMCNFINRIHFQKKWKMGGPSTSIKAWSVRWSYLIYIAWRVKARSKASYDNVDVVDIS